MKVALRFLIFTVTYYLGTIPRTVRPGLSRPFILAVIVAATSGDIAAQNLQAVPNPALVDQSVTIRATGLKPDERVTMDAELTDGAGARWSSQAQFVADEQGAIDTATQAPIEGSYKNVSGPGLIWSMRPIDKRVANYRAPEKLGPQTVEFRLIRGGQQVSDVTLRQLRVADGVKQIPVQGELHGILFLPAGDGPNPALLVVGGSEGGVPTGKAVWLAGHGYAAFALAYFRYENLSRDLENIPLEYFGRAIAWMMKRSEIEPDRIGVMGTSRGGELALQLGSMYPQVKAVVAYVPANVRYSACCGGTDVPYAWTWRGQPLSYLLPRNQSDPMMKMHAEIATENTDGPILMIGAEDDGIWESSRMVEEVAGRLERAHFKYAVEVLKYPHAGHRAGRPEIIPMWHGATIHPVSGRETNFGGTPPGDAASSLDAIPKVLDFLRKSLGATAPGGEAATK